MKTSPVAHKGRAVRRNLLLAAAVAAVAVLSAALPAAALPDLRPDPTYQADGRVLAIAFSPDGRIAYFGGKFTTVIAPYPSTQSTPRSRLAAIDTATGNLLSWSPIVDKDVNALAVSPDGKRVYIGGLFSSLNGLTAYKKVAAVGAAAEAGVPSNEVGAPITSFRPKVPALVKSMALSSDGTRLYIGGKFTKVNGTLRPHLAAINAADGKLVEAFDPKVEQLYAEPIGNTCRPRCPPNVAALALGPDSPADTDAMEEVYFGGTFGEINDVSRESAAQVYSANGDLTNWNPRVWSDRSFNQVWDLAHFTNSAGERVLICGNFYMVGGKRHPNMAVSLATSGSVNPADTGFVGSTDGAIVACEASNDGRTLYVGGHFGKACNCEFAKNAYTYNNRLHLAAFRSTDGYLEDWNPRADSSHGVFAMDVTASKFAIGGDFNRTGRPWAYQKRFAQYSGSP